jgi:D-glycero-alpha-D-manno-heptose-7-phosphate kinase
MIITRSPFRISFVGGGSDLESYYSHNGGAVVSVSIDKYIYLTAHRYFEANKSLLKYSRTEVVDSPEQIDHPILRSVFSEYGINGIDFNSTADIPSGTGMGSSSAFTSALIRLAEEYKGLDIQGQAYYAEKACITEIKKLNEPIGKQDQYGSCIGGLKFIEFLKDGTVNVELINLPLSLTDELNNNLFLFYTGIRRSASSVLESQRKEMSSLDKRNIVDKMVQLAYELKTRLQREDISSFGRILHEAWLLKSSISSKISTGEIGDLYNFGLKCGADGGKLLGAGGGGFLLFHVPKENHERFTKSFDRLQELKFNFEYSGIQTLYKK